VTSEQSVLLPMHDGLASCASSTFYPGSSHDAFPPSSEVVGYAEGKLDGRAFTASWATFCPLGAIFYDTWLDSTVAQTKAIARALSKVQAVPVPRTS
jgi:hypothetical protein